MGQKMMKGMDCLSYKEKLRARTVQPQKETAEGGAHQCVNIPDMGKGIEKMKPNSSQCSPDKRQWAQMEAHQIPFNHKLRHSLFPPSCESGQTLAQVPQRGCDLSSLLILKTQLDMALRNLL